MALGYALLHPGRVELALGAEPRQAVFDDLTDIVMSLVGGGNPGSAATAFVDSVGARVSAVSQLFTGLTGAGGPFAAISSFLSSLSSGPSGMPDVAAWLDRIIAFLEALAPETLRQKAGEWIDALLGAVPVLDSHQMFLALRDLVSQALAAFEKPFLDGRRDPAAHRLVRAATLVHSYLDGALENLEDALGSFTLRPILGQLVEYVLGGLRFTGMGRVIQGLRDARDALGPILTAMSNLSLSLTVDVSVGGPAPQPLGQPLGQPAGEPTWRDDHLPAPHMPGHALWWADLITNVFSTFNLLWELIRTAPWHRGWEIFLSILEIAWQLVRTLMRAINPSMVNELEPFLRWMFTDQAQFCLGLILRFGGSLNDAFAAPNYFLSAGLRVLRYYSYALTPRMFYLFGRSVWYLQSWKEDPWLLDGDGNPTAKEAPISIIRYCWALWPVNWAFAGLLGGIQPWESYNIAELQDYPLTIVSLAVGALGGWALSLAVMAGIGGDAFDYPLQRDFVLFAVWAVATAWLLLLITMAMWGVNQLQAAALPVGISLTVVLAILFIAMGAVWGEESSDGDEIDRPWLAHILVHVTGVMAFGAFGFIGWWYYVNEGRDAEGHWKDLVAGSSPYKLPYPAGKAYFCGQANHGVFSHYQSSPPNRYSYDFNEDEDEPVWAARAGLVVTVRETLDNGADEPNYVVVQHVKWEEKHDPGEANERVLTFTNYWHLSRGRVWVREGQPVLQGQHIADLDDTGVSALHHLHFSASGFQTAEEANIPMVFRDPSVQGFRNYPILFSWLPGGGHHDGKPIAMSFYESDNQSSQARLHPVAVDTDSFTDAAGAKHQHQILIDFESVPGTSVPEGKTWVRTTWADGHFHLVELSKEALLRIIRRESLTGLDTKPAAGHTHALTGDTHKVADHSDRLYQDIRPTLEHPPPGALQARRPGPYDLLGDQLIVRVNDRATEYRLFGASRPSVAGTLALDRSPVGALVVGKIGAAAATPPTSTTVTLSSEIGVRQAVRAMNQSARTSGQQHAFRVLPVLVIETRRRGSNAQLEVVSGSAAEALGLTAGAKARGTGVAADFDAVSGIAIGNLLTAGLDAAWPADGVGVTATVVADGLELHAGPDALELGASTPRIAAALKHVYRPGAGASKPLIAATGALPLTAGRLVLKKTPEAAVSWPVPILGMPARVEIDPAHPALGDATAREATPLFLRLREPGAWQAVWFQPGDADAAAMARRITATAEGVRAWVTAGGKIAVQSLAGGYAVKLRIEKKAPTGAPLTATDDGASPDVFAAPAGPAMNVGDTTAILPDSLHTMILDARWRAAQGPNPSPIATMLDAGQLVLERAGSVLTLVSDGTGLGFAAGAGADAGKLRSQPLAGVALRPGGWLDVKVDGGNVLRAVLDAEPARVDGAPLRRLPRSGEDLVLRVDGDPPRTVNFDGSAKNVADVAVAIAGALAAAGSAVTVRVAHRLVVENAQLTGPDPSVEVSASSAAAGAGFPHVLPAGAAGWGHGVDPLDVPTDLSGARTEQHRGPLIAAFEVAESGKRVTLTPRDAIHSLRVQSLHGAAVVDPLALTAAGKGLETRDVDPAVALAGHATGYRIQVMHDTTPVAETIVELSAAPATAVTTLAPVPDRIPTDAAGGRLTIHVKPPAGPEHEATVDLRGIGTLQDAADRINAAVPVVAAWADHASGLDRLYIQTLGGGRKWQLRLQNQDVLAALGFNPAAMTRIPADVAAKPSYEVHAGGRGNIDDGAAITRTEALKILSHAATHVTQLDDLSAPTRLSFVVDNSVAGALALRSAAGPVTIATSPPHLGTRLKPPGAPAGVHLAPGATPVSLDSGVIRVSVGGHLVAAAELHGTRATIEVPGALPTVGADVEKQLDALHARTAANPVTVTVDGTPTPVHGFPPRPASIPAGQTGYEDVIAHMAEFVPAAWFGIVERGGKKYFAVQSRTRGSSSDIAIDFGSIPAEGVLGWSHTDSPSASASGDGSVTDLDQVSLADVRGLLEAARNRGAGPQSLLEARVAGGNLELAALSPEAELNQRSILTTPGRLSMNNPGARKDLLTVPYGATLECQPGLVKVEVKDGGVTRVVRALVWASPARLPRMSLPKTPKSPADLNGKSLKIRIGDSTERIVTFHGIPAGDEGQARRRISAQIERACGWDVRARWHGDALEIATRVEGDSANIALLDVAADARGLLGLAGTGTLAGEAGTGIVSDLEKVTAAQYEVALDSDDSAFVTADPTQDSAQLTAVPIDFTGCRPRDPNVAAAPRFLRMRSERYGCMSSVIPLLPADALAGPESLQLDRTLERGPAVRASVELDAFLGKKALPPGELMILLNAGSPAPDHAPPAAVGVVFEGREYTAAEVAARIHEALFQRGVGMAACYPDGTVVVETLVNGIAGAIELPAPGSTVALAEKLCPGTVRKARGWPGAGAGAGTMRDGFRSEARKPKPNTQWRFRTERLAAVDAWQVDFKLPDGTIESCAQGLHTELGKAKWTGTPARPEHRIGSAAVGPDGCLYIEAAPGDSLFLYEVDGEGREMQQSTVISVSPTHVGRGAEPPVEPGLGLLRTNQLRTVRYVRDIGGADAAADLKDFGWVRSPTEPRSGEPAPFPFWPPGRYLLAVRSEAAQLGKYDGSGDMIISHGIDPTGPGDAGRAFVRRARYWVNVFAGSGTFSSEPLGVHRIDGKDLVVEIIVWR